MITLHLKRTIRHPKDGIFGDVHDECKSFIFKSLEPLHNRSNPNTCIKAGKYLAKKVKSNSFGVTFEVMGVGTRTLLYFHWGNFWSLDLEETDSTGCILLGEGVRPLLSRKNNMKQAVFNSKRACKRFMKFMRKHTEFDLIIEEPIWKY